MWCKRPHWRYSWVAITPCISSSLTILKYSLYFWWKKKKSRGDFHLEMWEEGATLLLWWIGMVEKEKSIYKSLHWRRRETGKRGENQHKHLSQLKGEDVLKFSWIIRKTCVVLADNFRMKCFYCTIIDFFFSRHHYQSSSSRGSRAKRIFTLNVSS